MNTVNDVKPVPGSGVEWWVFWLMLVIIFILITVILVRDKIIREHVKLIFSKLRRKVHNTAVKLKISKEREKIASLFIQLGQKAYECELIPRGIRGNHSRLHDLCHERDELNFQLQTLEKTMDRERKQFAEFNQRQDRAIKEQEQLKAPQVDELNRLKKESKDIDKTVSEKEKIKARNEKKISSCHLKIIDIRADRSLSRLEVKNKVSELESQISQIEEKTKKIAEDLKAIYHEKGNPGKAMEKITPEVERFERVIQKLKEERKRKDKEFDSRNRELLKKKVSFTNKLKHLQRDIEVAFRRLGRELKVNKVDAPELASLYAQIESAETSISRLEKKISS